MNIWQFQRLVSRRLLMWSVGSILLGGWWWRQRDPWWRGIGLHALIWGLIDAAIALGGMVGARKRRQAPDALAPETMRQETVKLRRLLWLNAGLDVGYMLGGRWLRDGRGAHDRYWRGQGVGIIIQGLFLFIFDCWHAWQLRPGRVTKVITKDKI